MFSTTKHCPFALLLHLYIAGLDLYNLSFCPWMKEEVGGLGETDLVQRGPSFLKHIFPFFPVKSAIFPPSIRPSIVYLNSADIYRLFCPCPLDC